MTLHVALQPVAALAASKRSSQKALKSCCAVVPCVKCISSILHSSMHTNTKKQLKDARTRKVRAHSSNTCTHQKLQGYFDLICLCYSSWKRLCSRQHIISAWEEMTAGFPPSLFSSLLTAFSSFVWLYLRWHSALAGFQHELWPLFISPL